MPAAAAAAIRVIIQAAVSTGIFVAIEAALAPLIDAAKRAVQNAYDMTPEEAEDTIANEVIDALAVFGILGIAIKSKLPTIAAEKLGFTSKGYFKRKISPKVPSAKTNTVAATLSKNATVTMLPAAQASAVLSGAKTTMRGAGKAVDFLQGKLNTVFLAFLVIGGFIDFANWETGAYSNFFQNLFAKITGGLLVPNEDYRKTKTASPEVFTKVYETYKLSGAVGINDPFKMQSLLFTRDNLIDLVDQVGAGLLLAQGSASTKEVLLGTQLYIVFSQAAINAGGAAPVSTSTGGGTSGGSVAPITKVFTGIVSQGVVGQGLVFTPRPDDLIESAEELRQAAANNLSAYLVALPGKIVYEVKVVPSIVTREGFRQSGQTQQIKTGTYADGRPKYKTVTNKFAQLVVYALTDKGTRTKLTTIVLGPTDSAKLTVAVNDLRELEQALPGLVTTTDINDITGIATSNPITVSTPPAAGGTPTPAPGAAVSGQSPTSLPAGVSSANVPGLSAATLTEWYQAQGQALPSVSTRSQIYAQLGLGQAGYYSGTTEQNTKLLAALKLQAAQKVLAQLQAQQAAQQSSGSSSSSTTKPSSSSSTSQSSTTKPATTTSSKNVPTMKGKKVDISSSKIKEKTNSKGEKYATIDGTIFSVSEYKEFKSLRAKYT